MLRQFYSGLIATVFSLILLTAFLMFVVIYPITHWGVWWGCFIALWICFVYGVRELEKVADYIRDKEAIDSIELVELDRPPEAEKQEFQNAAYREIEAQRPDWAEERDRLEKFIDKTDLFFSRSMGPVDDAIRERSRECRGSKYKP